MAIDTNNFIIDRVRRGTMFSTTDGSALWSINQITNPSLSMTSESVDAVDAIGVKVMTFERAKEATFSAESAIFDLGLLAAQTGSEKVVATSAAKITVPISEDFTVSGASITLSQTPKEDLTHIYVLTGSGNLGVAYTSATSADATHFKQSGKVITLPTGVTSGRVTVMYDYESDNAVKVVNSAEKFPKAGKFRLEVLGADVCDPTGVVTAYLRSEERRVGKEC